MRRYFVCYSYEDSFYHDREKLRISNTTVEQEHEFDFGEFQREYIKNTGSWMTRLCVINWRELEYKP